MFPGQLSLSHPRLHLPGADVCHLPLQRTTVQRDNRSTLPPGTQIQGRKGDERRRKGGEREAREGGGGREREEGGKKDGGKEGRERGKLSIPVSRYTTEFQSQFKFEAETDVPLIDKERKVSQGVIIWQHHVTLGILL